MSRFSGKQPPGAQRAWREQKRTEAEARNARTPDARRRAAREGSVEYRGSTSAPPVSVPVLSGPAAPPGG